MTNLDHGILNVPLSKRGNIDAEIDRYKRDQAQQKRAERKAHAADMRTLRAEAKGLLSEAPAERIADLAKKCGLTPAKMRDDLRSKAHWQPALVIRVCREWEKKEAA